MPVIRVGFGWGIGPFCLSIAPVIVKECHEYELVRAEYDTSETITSEIITSEKSEEEQVALACFSLIAATCVAIGIGCLVGAA